MSDPVDNFREAWTQWRSHRKGRPKEEAIALHFFRAGLDVAIHLARRERLAVDLEHHDPLDVLIGVIAKRK